jgi:hypothetical protein
MKLKNYNLPLIAILILSVFVVSCREEWDNHYYEKALNKSSLNLYQYIQSRKELSIFTKMLNSTKYDSILSKSQTYTVWAPNDSALKDVDLNDSVAVIKIVKNHITRFSCPTSAIGISSKIMLMLNNKLIPFAKSTGGFTFGGKRVVESDLATANGIIHILGEYAPYKRNIWEFLNETDGLDSLKKYINSLTKMELDNSKSYQNGVFVDSVFMSTNFVLDNLAALKTEDSIYSAILPNNTAWTEAYSRIFPYFNTLPKDGGVPAQIAYTKLALVMDLFFRGKKTVPLAEDTLKSTNGNIFISPNKLFENAQANEMSNGLSYVTSQLKYTAAESWCKEYRIEAENSYYGRLTSNYNANPIPSIGTGFNISRGYYLSLVPTTVSSISTLFATFSLPNTLSTKYNIYCVFVPSIITDPADLKPYKAKFYLSYVGADGKQVTDATIDINNTVQAPTKVSNTFITDPTKVQKMLVVKDFTFPYSNLYTSTKSVTTVALKVKNDAKVTDVGYNRNVKIDCIILEPVQ